MRTRRKAYYRRELARRRRIGRVVRKPRIVAVSPDRFRSLNERFRAMTILPRIAHRELTDEAERYERAWKGKDTTNYGMDCDRRTWLEFHAWVKSEIEKRKEGGAHGA